MSKDTETNFLNPNEAATYLRVSKSHLARLQVHGGGPRYAKLGPKLVVYRLEDLQACIALRATSTICVADAALGGQTAFMSSRELATPMMYPRHPGHSQSDNRTGP